MTPKENFTMAHQIETNGDEAAAIFARTDPWHRLGTTVRGRAFTAEEAMGLGHLGGWRVRKAPLVAHDVTADGVTTIDAPGYATVRDNPFSGCPEALGVVGAGYEPLQNEDHAEFLNNLADQSDAVFDTAGSLRGGRQVFITMQLPDTLTIGGTDAVDLNIAALNSHDGSGAFRILVTSVRVVCANTQAAALENHASSFSVRHTRNAKSAVAAARDALGLTFRYVEAFEAEAERLIQTTLTDGEFENLIEAAFGPLDPDASERTKQADAERHAALSFLFHDAGTQAGIRGTAWAGYQAVAEYVDHYAPVRAKGDPAAARATRLLTSDAPTKTKHRAWSALAAA
jgi:phage/plasmid-like protein (TIGR03299 family)